MTPVCRRWSRGVLGDVTHIIRNGIFVQRPTDDGVGNRILRISAVRSGVLDLSQSRYVEGLSQEQIAKFSVDSGDILLTRYNGSRHLVGIAGVVPDHAGTLLHPDKLIRVVVNRKVLEPQFLNLQLQTRSVRTFLEPRIRTTAGQSGIAGTDVRCIPLVLPSLIEQRRIVDILEDHLSRLDAAERYAKAGATRLRSLAEAAFNSRVAALDSDERPMVDLLAAPLSNGRSVPTRDGGFPVLRLTALKEAGVDLRERKGGDWTRADAARYLVEKGDFLIARGNGSLRLVGRGSLVRHDPDEVAYPDTAIKAKVSPRMMDSEFLDLAWNSRRTRRQLEGMARTSAGIYKLNQKQLEGVRLPVPPLRDQTKLVTELAIVRNLSRSTGQAVERALLQARALRRALLSAAFSGRLTGTSTDVEVIEEVADAQAGARAAN